LWHFRLRTTRRCLKRVVTSYVDPTNVQLPPQGGGEYGFALPCLQGRYVQGHRLLERRGNRPNVLLPVQQSVCGFPRIPRVCASRAEVKKSHRSGDAGLIDRSYAVLRRNHLDRVWKLPTVNRAELGRLGVGDWFILGSLAWLSMIMRTTIRFFHGIEAMISIWK